MAKMNIKKTIKSLDYYQAYIWLISEGGLHEWFTYNEATQLIKEAYYNHGIKMPRRILDYCASQLLNSEHWHLPESSFEEIDEVLYKYGASTSRWKELTEVLDYNEAYEMIRIMEGRTAKSCYYFKGEQLKIVADIFDLWGRSAYGRSGSWWDTTIGYMSYECIKKLPNHEKKPFINFIKGFKSKYVYASIDEQIKMLHRYGVKKGGEYLYKGFKDPEITDLYAQLEEIPDFLYMESQYFHGCDDDWDDDEKADIVPAIEKVPFCGLPKGVTHITEPEVKNKKVKALTPFIGPVNAVREYTGFHDMDKRSATDIYQWLAKYPSWDSDRFVDPDQKTRGWIVPRTWNNWQLVLWLKDKIASAFNTMDKIRIVHGPAGQTKEFKYLDILDEITPADLINGIKTKPDKVFEAAAKRKEQQLKTEMGEDVKLPKAPWKDTREVKQLLHSDDLKMESKIMDNCVKGYTRACIAEKTYIYHVGISDYKSGATMEVTPDKKILQLYEAGNQSARKQLVDMMEDWIKKNGGDFQIQLQG